MPVMIFTETTLTATIPGSISGIVPVSKPASISAVEVYRG